MWLHGTTASTTICRKTKPPGHDGGMETKAAGTRTPTTPQEVKRIAGTQRVVRRAGRRWQPGDETPGDNGRQVIVHQEMVNAGRLSI